MKKESAGVVQWFVDFANLGLETVKAGDRAKLLIESEEYLWPKEEMKEFQASSPTPLSEKLLGRMAWALREKIPPKESREYWAIILRSQKFVQDLFVRDLIPIVRPSPNAPAKPTETPSPSWIAWGEDRMLWWIRKGHKFPYRMKFLPITQSQKDYLRLKIFTLLEGFPDHAIRKCPGCEKFFFNPTWREKNFDSNRCMWRTLTAKRREADKEGYRKYQRELMRDRYLEKNGHPRRKTKKRKVGDKAEIAKRKGKKDFH